MKKAVMLLFLSVLLLGACFNAVEKIDFVPKKYNHWNKTVDEGINEAVPGHMDKYRVIYINDKGENYEKTLVNNKVVHNYPPGSIIVKEIYAGTTYEEGMEPVECTVMYKDPDHELAQGGWLWIHKDFGSGKETIMDSDFCLECHVNANENHPYGDNNKDNEFRDYVFFPFIEKEDSNETTENVSE